ncbi:MAG: hypothetical protein Q9179_006161 [Wetmoreana sp. 5 TL-2023]
MFGSYEETGLGSGYCFERYARNSPYGDNVLPDDGQRDRPQLSNVDWEKVDWGQLQHECAILNRNRFEEKSQDTKPPMFRYPDHEDIQQVNSTLILPESRVKSRTRSNVDRRSSGSKKYKKRNAILLRTYDSKEYTPDNMHHIRSMITELSLHSGAEYEVFLLVQIVDLEKPIFFDSTAYQEALDLYVPREFHNISVLFNVPLMEAWYPKVGKHDPNNSQQVHMTQPLQLFSLLRPEFDLYWQFELDVRYTGHHYHHLEAIRQWAQKRPRKLQWERAAYFYSPFIHQTWSKFCRKIQDMFTDRGIWGAVTTTGISPVGPSPSTSSPEEDDFEWGVGEPADFINISPIVDPVQTHMMFRDWVDNYPDGLSTPRRVAAVTPMIATSKRLLRAMHHSQVTMGAHMMPEMFPASSALQHGLKAVAFPEPVYLDIDDKTPEELESIFNDQTITGMWNGSSPNSKLAQHISYWWSAGFKPEYSNVFTRSKEPVVNINDASFYRQHPTTAAEGAGSNPVIFPNLTFNLPSSSPKPEYWCIIGPSSAGKTTFFEILRGQHLCFPPTARSFPYLASAEIEQKDHRLRIPSRAIQYVGFAGKHGGGLRGGSTTGAYLSARYESRREETDFSVLDYLKGNMELNPFSKESEDVGNDASLQRVIVDLKLEALVDMPVGNLSNGQTRRAKIAKALLGKPEVLLLDEPFMGLDPPTIKTLSPLLHDLAEAQAPRIVLSLRPQDPLPDWITHILYIGPELRIARQGRKDAVLGSLSSRESANSISKPAALEEKMQGQLSREGLPLRDSRRPTTGKPIVEMHDVQVKYGNQIVLGNWASADVNGHSSRGLNWTVRRGERWGVFGPNGSGKTTLISLICSDHPQSYSLPITLFSRPRLPRPGNPGISIFDLQSRIGHSSPEIHNFFPKQLSLRRCLESAWSDTFLSPPSLSCFCHTLVDTHLRWFEPELKPSWSPPEVASTRTTQERVVKYDGKTLDLDSSTDWAAAVQFSNLPFSAQRLALLLRALIKKPDLVVLDEAFSGMDASLRDKCMLFLTWGTTKTLSSNPQYKFGRVSVTETPKDVLGDEGLVEGLGKEQALVCISHVEEEVPGVVRDWLCLPEAKSGERVRFGRFEGPLEGIEGGWERIWGRDEGGNGDQRQ